MSRTLTVSDSIVVAADPLTLWTAIADPTQMPRWSPENTGARVPSEPHPLQVGERFSGTNHRFFFSWITGCTVTASEPGKVFEFRVGTIGLGRPFIRAKNASWRYTFEEVPGGTLVTETWTDDRPWPDWLARGFDYVATGGRTFDQWQVGNIARTLKALQADFA